MATPIIRRQAFLRLRLLRRPGRLVRRLEFRDAIEWLYLERGEVEVFEHVGVDVELFGLDDVENGGAAGWAEL